jgi:hypothetical protein
MIQYDGKVLEARDRDIYTTLALTPTRPLIHLHTAQSYQISIGRPCILRSPSFCAEFRCRLTFSCLCSRDVVATWSIFRQVCRAGIEEVCRQPMVSVGSCGDPTPCRRVYAARHDPELSLLASRRLPPSTARTIVDSIYGMLVVFSTGSCE